MVKGALGVFGACVLLAIGCAQAFALDPVSSVPVVTTSVPALPISVPTVSVPVVTSVVSTVSDATASAPSTLASPSSAPLPGTATTSDSSAASSSSSSGTSGSASGSSPAQPSAKSQRSGTIRRFEARPPKFRSRGKGRRGTTLVVWLSTDSLVAFSIVQIAPNCRGVGGFTRAGDQGRNRFSFSGRIDGRALRAGTYRIRATAVQGQKVTAVRRDTVVVVAPGQSIRSARAQKSTCGPGEEAAEGRAEIAALADVEPPSTGRSPVEAHGATGEGNRAVVAPESVVPPPDFFLQLRAPNLAIASDAKAGSSLLALTTLGAMIVVLFVIGGWELAERYRERDAGWR
jgi:hypothetical protein